MEALAYAKLIIFELIQGVRVSDFYNYTSDVLPQPGTPIETYGDVLSQGGARLLSEIKLENVTIRQLE